MVQTSKCSPTGHGKRSKTWKQTGAAAATIVPMSRQLLQAAGKCLLPARRILSLYHTATSPQKAAPSQCFRGVSAAFALAALGKGRCARVVFRGRVRRARGALVSSVLPGLALLGVFALFGSLSFGLGVWRRCWLAGALPCLPRSWGRGSVRPFSPVFGSPLWAFWVCCSCPARSACSRWVGGVPLCPCPWVRGPWVVCLSFRRWCLLRVLWLLGFRRLVLRVLPPLSRFRSLGLGGG